jgi:hypothetical protein
MKKGLFIVLLLLVVKVNAQTSFVFELNCKDKNTQENIPNVNALFQAADSAFKAKSNFSGKIFVKLLSSEKFTISMDHGYYDSESLTVFTPKSISSNDTIRKTVYLTKTKVKMLNEVVVLAPGAVQVLFQSEKLSVSDFEILPNGELLLLAYPKRLDKGSELLIYDGKQVLQSFKLKENPKELIHDFRGNVHVVCENGVYGIHREKKNIEISTIDKAYYMKYIFPVVDTVQSKLFFSNFNPNYPAFDYLAFDQLDSTFSKIMEIKDDLMMELYRAEYKWVDVRTKLWAANKEIETGIDKEIWVGANYFTNTVYYKELYAPMFRKNDSIYVFDYYKDLLFSFDSRGNKLDSIPIFHHYQPKQTGWKRNLLQDEITGDVYAFFEKAGICSVQKINLRTGILGDKIQFDHKYVDKVAINGGKAYYIYRPFESAQKKFLYVTQLP